MPSSSNAVAIIPASFSSPSFMESTRSPSSSPQRLFSPTQPFADRILRSLNHRLRLLHRSDDSFFVLGQTGNVYTVILSSSPSCSCPDRTIPCKHILFVFLRVLRLSIDDPCVRRRTLRPCHLARLLGSPLSPDTLAGRRARERFHQLLATAGESACKVEDGDTCPVCMEEMKREEGRLVACSVCGNSVHEECLVAWKRSRGRRAASCVVCRAKWRERTEQGAYMNLAAYVSEEDNVELEEGRGSRSCRAP